jgi:adenosylhomocysteine nucleosidase
VNMTGSNGASPVNDAAALIAELRMLLQMHHASGQIDDVTYEGARDELEVADSMATDPDPAKRHKSALALKKFGGVMSDVTDIAAKAATAASGTAAGIGDI